MNKVLWCLVLAMAFAMCGCAEDTRYPWQCVTDKDCVSHNPCLEDMCLDSICVSVVLPDGVACDDGSVCTFNDSCQLGMCVGQELGLQKFLQELCLVVTCDPKEGFAVGYQPNGAPCVFGQCMQGACLPPAE